MNRVFKIGSLEFKNPVLTASGTFGMGELLKDFMDYSKLGGITLKTVTRSPRDGNPPPRIYETPCGLLNSIGLENEGFDRVYARLKEDDYLEEYPTNVIFSIAGDTIDDFAEMAEAFSLIEGIDMIELNLSCPNVKSGGMTFDCEVDTVESIVKKTASAMKKSEKPFTVKLSPMQDIVKNARVAEESGSNAVTISNTYIGVAIDIKTGEFVFKNKTAGFSGPAVKPLSLYNVYRVAQTVKIPVIASGGICSTEDAIEFMLAGANFVSIGTMTFIEPDIAVKVADGIERYLGCVKSFSLEW